ncbi:hypothetical protein HDG35_006244 [Paraburkholderia sp. JPY681]|nr:hypothetical protein [Paraburkholderia atlantica]
MKRWIFGLIAAHREHRFGNQQARVVDDANSKDPFELVEVARLQQLSRDVGFACSGGRTSPSESSYAMIAAVFFQSGCCSRKLITLVTNARLKIRVADITLAIGFHSYR